MKTYRFSPQVTRNLECLTIAYGCQKKLKIRLDLESEARVQIGWWTKVARGSYYPRDESITLHFKNIKGWRIAERRTPKRTKLEICYSQDCKVKTAMIVAHEICHLRQPLWMFIFGRLSLAKPTSEQQLNSRAVSHRLKSTFSKVCYYLSPSELHARWFAFRHWRVFYFALWGQYSPTWLEQLSNCLSLFQEMTLDSSLVPIIVSQLDTDAN